MHITEQLSKRLVNCSFVLNRLLFESDRSLRNLLWTRNECMTEPAIVQGTLFKHVDTKVEWAVKVCWCPDTNSTYVQDDINFNFNFEPSFTFEFHFCLVEAGSHRPSHFSLIAFSMLKALFLLAKGLFVMPEKIEMSSGRVLFFLGLDGTFYWFFSILSLKRDLIGTLRGDRCEAKNPPKLPPNLHPSSLKEHEINAKKIVFLTRWMQALQLWTQIPQYSWFLSNDGCWEVPADTFSQVYFVRESRHMIPFHQFLELILFGSTIKHCWIDC